MKKILDIIPVLYTEDLKGAIEDRKKFAEEVSRQTTGLIKLESVSLEKGTASIESFYDEALNVPNILEQAKKAEEKGFDAVIIDCMGDPGLDAARELVKIPVLGANESACHLAAQIAPRFSILNVVAESENAVRSAVIRNGTIQSLASIVTIDIPVLALEKEPEKTIAKMVQASEKAIKQDGAQSIVFGCTGMSSLVKSIEDRLKAKGINAPVIEPLRATVYNAIMWILMGISQSKEAYMPPRPKLRKLV
jgi:allantoin racemase